MTTALSIGGVTIALRERLRFDVEVKPHRSGRREISIQAEGSAPPDLSAVNFALPVVVAYTDHLGSAKTITVLSEGPQRSDDIAGAWTSWSLTGVESLGGGGALTIGGTTYWGTVQVAYLGGTIQRMSDGSGVLLSAWSKRKVTLAGEGAASVPAVGAGTVAITSNLYTGDLVTLGVSRSWDPDTGLTSWTLEGEEP